MANQESKGAKGQTVLLVILILVALALVGLIGYVLLERMQDDPLPPEIQHTTDSAPSSTGEELPSESESEEATLPKGEFNRWIKATNSAIRDIKKKITALLDWLKEMKAEMAKPQTMDLFAMLQLYFDQRNAGAYSQRAKVNNLKEYSELCQYLLDHGITDITALENHVNDLRTTTDSLKKKLDAQTAQMKTLRKIPEYFDDYKRLKPVFDGLQKIKFTKAREKYKAEHTNDLKRFYEAQRIISQKFPDGKFDRKVLEAEYEELERQHDATYAEFKTIRAESQQLWKIKSHIDTARKAMGYSLEHQSKKQEQEI